MPKLSTVLMNSIFSTLWISLSISLSSCAPAVGTSGACDRVPSDQKESFTAAVSGYPVTITADARFSYGQRQSLSQGITQWNTLGRQEAGQELFRLRYADMPSRINALNPADCRQDFGSETTLLLVLESSAAHWSSMGLNERIPGATFRCERGDSLVRQIIYVRPDLVQPSQFSSMILHELGHSLGLDHSCLSGAGRPGFRSCSGLLLAHPYRQAVMFPSIRVPSPSGESRGVAEMPKTPEVPEIPEIKDTLRENDLTRARCRLSST